MKVQGKLDKHLLPLGFYRSVLLYQRPMDDMEYENAKVFVEPFSDWREVSNPMQESTVESRRVGAVEVLLFVVLFVDLNPSRECTD